MDKKHYVYILKCADGTYYTGYTTDPLRRTQVHNSGKGAKYTRARRPVELIYTEEYDDKTEAQRREYAIKQLTRAEKEKLMYEKKIEEYAAKAKERWGDTDAFREYEKKSAGRNAEEHRAIADQMMDIFAEFGKIKDSSPESEEAVVLVRKLQDFIKYLNGLDVPLAEKAEKAEVIGKIYKEFLKFYTEQNQAFTEMYKEVGVLTKAAQKTQKYINGLTEKYLKEMSKAIMGVK